MSFVAFVWAHLGAARGRYVAGQAMTGVEGVAGAVPALAVGLGLSRLAQGAAPDDIAPYAAAIVLSVIVRVLAIRRAWQWGYEAGNVATEAIRNRLVDHMLGVPLNILGRWPPARMATLIVEDGRWLNEVSTFTLSRLFAGVATTACLGFGVLYFDIIVGLALMAAFAASLAVMPVMSRVLTSVMARRNAGLIEAIQRIGEYSEGIAVFRSFRRTGAAQAQLRQAVEQLQALMVRKVPLLVLLQQAGSMLATLSVPLSIVLLAAATLSAGADPGADAIVPALFLALAANHALHAGVLRPLMLLRLGLLAHAGMKAFLDEPVLQGGAAAFNSPLDIQLEAVRFRYGSDAAEALRDVDFRVGEGGVSAIVGPSGAGKSTVAGLIMRFFDPDSGSVSIGGVDARQEAPVRLQALVSLVDQDVHLFHDTLRANLLLGDPAADDARLASVVAAARLEDLVAALPQGLDTVLGGTGRTLSGGERQRVAIARALLKDAPILLLDEATSATDPVTERAIQEAVAALEKDRTVIVIAHRLHTIVQADQILVMERGCIVERGRHRELLDRDGLYARLWRSQERAAGWRLR